MAAVASESVFDAARFRPSLLLATPDLDGIPENEWAGRTLTVGDVELSVSIPTPRCVMTTVAQPGLERDPGILQTIAQTNRHTNRLGTFACLGCYATITAGGTIETGAPVSLT